MGEPSSPWNCWRGRRSGIGSLASRWRSRRCSIWASRLPMLWTPHTRRATALRRRLHDRGCMQIMRTCGRECCQIAFAFFLFSGLSANLRAQTNQVLPGCKDVAPLPPVLTLVGPGTTPARANEVAFAAGAWGNLFPAPCAHETGVNWFGRWDLGLTHRLDWGFDFQGTEHSSFQSLSATMTARYELLKNLRLETGIGLGDDTEGKSLTGEVGATMGIPGGKRK